MKSNKSGAIQLTNNKNELTNQFKKYKLFYKGNISRIILLFLSLILIGGYTKGSAVLIEEANIDTLQSKTTIDHRISYWKEGAYKEFPKDIRPPKKATIAIITKESRRIRQTYNGDEFDYSEAKQKSSTFWERVGNWISDFFKSITPDINFNFTKLIIYILYGIGGFAILFILYKLFINKQKHLIRNPKESGASEIEFVERNLQDIDIQTYIDKAKKEENWNLAIRYLQLLNLQYLAQKGQIEWDYRKTNQDFIYEIKDPIIQEKFKNTTTIFNYVWYGNFEMNKEKFITLQSDFMQLKNKLP